MTTETKCTLELSDIKKIHITCGKCGAIQIRKLDQRAHIDRCCSCNEDILRDTEMKSIDQLCNAISDLLKSEGNKAFKIALEIAAPKS